MQPGTELSSINFGAMLGGPLNAAIAAQTTAAMNTVNFIKQVGFDKKGNIRYVDFKYDKEVVPFTPGNTDQVVSITFTGGTGYATAPSVTITPATAGVGAGATAIAVIDGIGAITAINITNSGAGYKAAPTVTVTGGTGIIATGATTPTAPTAPTALTGVLGTRPDADPVYREMKLTVPFLSMLPVPFIRIDKVTIDFNAKINSVETFQQDTDFGVDVTAGGSVGFAGIGSANLSVSVSYKQTTSVGSNVERTYSLVVHMEASQEEMPAGMLKIFGILETQMKSVPAKAA